MTLTWLYENFTVPFTGFTLVKRVSLQNLLQTSLLNLSCKWKILWFQFKISICCIWSWDFLLNFLEVRISCNFEDLISYFWYWIPQFLNVDGRVICFFGKRGWVKNLKVVNLFLRSWQMVVKIKDVDTRHKRRKDLYPVQISHFSDYKTWNIYLIAIWMILGWKNLIDTWIS